MLINCPVCDKKYMIDDTNVKGKGRKVRCGACGHVWFYESQEPLNLDPKEAGIQEHPRFKNNGISGIPFEEEETDTSKMGIYAWIKKYYIDWLIIIFAILAIIGITLYERGSFFENPPEPNPPLPEPYYAPYQNQNMGEAKPKPSTGLSIAGVRYALDNSQTPQHILVTGEVVNSTGETLSVPQLRITVHAREKANDLKATSTSPPVSAYTWKHQPNHPQILPGERIVFKTTMPSPGWATINKLFVAFDKKP